MGALDASVWIVALVLLYRLVLRKGDLRAGARFGTGSFFLEVRDKKHDSPDRTRLQR